MISFREHGYVVSLAKTAVGRQAMEPVRLTGSVLFLTISSNDNSGGMPPVLGLASSRLRAHSGSDNIAGANVTCKLGH
jgi:hypothetical protein